MHTNATECCVTVKTEYHNKDLDIWANAGRQGGPITNIMITIKIFFNYSYFK